MRPIIIIIAMVLAFPPVTTNTLAEHNGVEGPSTFGEDWRCFHFPDGVELHRKLDKDGWLSSEKRLEDGRLVYDKVFHPDGSAHVENLHDSDGTERRIWRPAPEELAGGTYRPGQAKLIEFYKEGRLCSQRYFNRDGGYSDREYQNGNMISETSCDPHGAKIYRQVYSPDHRFEYFYGDGKIKKTVLMPKDASGKPVATYYDRSGRTTTEEQTLRYEATLRPAEEAPAVNLCGLAIAIKPEKQSYTLGEEMELLLRVTCLAKEGVSLQAAGEGASESTVDICATQQTGFGYSVMPAFAPEEMKGQKEIALKQGQTITQRLKIRPWGPVFSMIPSVAYPGLLGLRATLRCKLADGKTIAAPESACVYVVVSQKTGSGESVRTNKN
ncbi:MAG: hypothetical protein NTX50_00380 [Candidatus Sumerlaeota bacterium]|nr:hypothetical protein [Candidatus Sumerlaeota bacterium]